MNRYLIFFGLGVIGCAADLASKSWIFARLGNRFTEGRVPQPPIWLIDEVFGFETSLNEGALFGVGQGMGSLFITLSIVAFLGVLVWLFYFRAAHDRLLNFALGLVSGGIFGNLYDRLGLPGLKWSEYAPHHSPGSPVYAVRDWLHFKLDAWNFDWPIFNIADCLLVCGAALLIVHALLSGQEEAPTPASGPASHNSRANRK